MRAVLLVVLAAGCGFKVGGTGQPDSGGHDALPIDAATDAPVDQAIGDDAPRSWWDPAWAHRRRITINNAMLVGDVSDFPVLVRIPAASLAGNIQTDCDDLRFVEADDVTPVAVALDTCGGGNADTTVWIKRTLAQASTPAHTLWLYYGAGGGDVFDGTAVFGTGGAGYESVHHMGVTTDATDNGHGLSAQGGVTATTGQISQASDFDGVDDYYSLSNENDFDFTTTMSASAWVKVGAFTDQWQAILAKGDDTWRIHRGDTTNGVGFGTTSGGTHDDLNGSTNINDGAWHHVAIVMDGTTKYLYVDGVEDEQRAYTLTLDTNSRVVRIGMNQDASPNRYWEGQIDEVRISGVARSAAWINAEQLTAVSTTFVTIGDDEPF